MYRPLFDNNKTLFQISVPVVKKYIMEILSNDLNIWFCNVTFFCFNLFFHFKKVNLNVQLLYGILL